MKHFRFKLSQVLKLRVQETDGAKLHMLRASRRQEAADSKLRQATAALAEQVNETVGELSLQVARWAQQRRYLNHLRLQVDQARQESEAAHAAVEAARRELLERRRHQETLERLRERSLAQYRLDAGRQQQHQLDDMIQSQRPDGGR